jgi:hypothetical protein
MDVGQDFSRALDRVDASSRDAVRDALYQYADNLRAIGITEPQVTTLVIETAALKIVNSWKSVMTFTLAELTREHPMPNDPKPKPTPPAKPAPKPTPPERDRPERPTHPIAEPDPIPHDDAPTQADI